MLKKHKFAATTLFAAMLAASGSASALPHFPSKKPGKEQGHGVIKFVGAIIDAPCSISPGSDNQVVELGQTANSALEQGKEGPRHAFNIKLDACTFDTAKTVAVTFDGIPANAGKSILAINGTAKGAGIALTDEQGTPVVLGDATKAKSLNSGDNTLRFDAKVVPLPSDGVYPPITGGQYADVTPGNFEATTTFTLSYQ